MTALARAIAVLVAVVAMPLATAGADQNGCLGELGLASPSLDMPVILVHGFTGTTQDMASITAAVDGRAGLASYPFDYAEANQQWVDDARIGPRLGEWVGCLADSSLEAGGVGRVVIVAHSMGGLAARAALTGQYEGTPLATRVALVATLGTPHLGSAWAGVPTDGSLVSRLVRELFEEALAQVGGPNLDNPAGRALAVGSPELAALADWPDGVPVWAGAGNFIAEQRLLFFTKQEPAGDIIVSEPSATARAPMSGQLGGPNVDRCLIPMPLDLGPVAVSGAIGYAVDHDPSLLNCYHGLLTDNQLLLDPLLTQVSAAAARPARVVATVVANGDGIAGTNLMEPAGDLFDRLTQELGPADDDTGFQEIPCLPGDPARERSLRWGPLSVTVTDDPARFPYPFLSAWLLDAAQGDQPEALTVEPPVALGDRYEDVAAQGAAWDEFYGSWELANLFGVTSASGPDPDAVVTAFGAGSTGLLGC